MDKSAQIQHSAPKWSFLFSAPRSAKVENFHTNLRDHVNGGQMLVSHFDTYMNGSQTPKSLTPTLTPTGTLIHPNHW